MNESSAFDYSFSSRLTTCNGTGLQHCPFPMNSSMATPPSTAAASAASFEQEAPLSLSNTSSPQHHSAAMMPSTTTTKNDGNCLTPKWYPKWRGRPLYRGNPEALGWALDGAARSIQFIGAGAFLSTSLLRLAKEAAGCATEPPPGETIVPECNEAVYGIKPSSLLTTYTMVVGVASSAMLPLMGAVVDYTPHRLRVGRTVSGLFTVLVFPTLFLNEDNWFAIAILQVVISFIGWAQTAITFSYLPELTEDEHLLGHWTKNFTMTQFLTMVLYLAAVIGGVSIAGRGDDDMFTSQVSMSIAFAANALLLPLVWGFLFKPRQPLHKLPEGRSLWSMGFVQLWQTSKHIVKNYRALKWFYFSVAL